MEKPSERREKITEKISSISIKIGIQLLTSFCTMETSGNISLFEMQIHHLRNTEIMRVERLYHKSFHKKLKEESPHEKLKESPVKVSSSQLYLHLWTFGWCPEKQLSFSLLFLSSTIYRFWFFSIPKRNPRCCLYLGLETWKMNSLIYGLKRLFMGCKT